MGHYAIYWIKNEFSYHYSYHSDILYRFLKEVNCDQADNILQRQFNFVTNSFPVAPLVNHLQQNLQESFTLTAKANRITINGKQVCLTLHIHEKQINFRCKRLQEAEEVLLPALRSFHPCLFVIQTDYANYGWVGPIYNNLTSFQGQVLYS